ncbi:S-layer homology domain-containing protein [Aneurinibacillus sp. Ricciae_BoGa-3]|uniref:S-layer homology domain-containing protein n=1 Tax=Aneurinibacillus sp. Ricciae_BoGa-3 TaxID=3022697 RepID=UPI00233F83A1|nr:S-layer homology domain-containing protein [Aneurinibacillus sp. Ricciae_BoGa-3]WCK56546.1 S-layer homology domain-containing protein [Aneurinibacillus sp. Ricciae_BoGa-3]
MKRMNRILVGSLVASNALLPVTAMAADTTSTSGSTVTNTTSGTTIGSSTVTAGTSTTTGDSTTINTGGTVETGGATTPGTGTNPPVFKDFKSVSTWAMNYVVTAKELGFIAGDTDGRFRPLDTMSRQEVAVVLSKMLGLDVPTVTTSSFHDVKAPWSRDYIEAVRNAGIMLGDGKNFFPSKPITREELAVILVKSAAVNIDQNPILPIVDKGVVSYWARPYVAAAIQTKLMVGDKQYFYPRKNAQRQEVAAISFNLHNLLSAGSESAGSGQTGNQTGGTTDQTPPVSVNHSTYKLDVSGLTQTTTSGDTLTVQSGMLIPTTNVSRDQIDVAVEAAVKNRTSTNLTITTDKKGDTGFVQATIASIASNSSGSANASATAGAQQPHVQIWAKGSDGHWYDLYSEGLGATSSLSLSANDSQTIPVYVMTDAPGSYPIKLRIVDAKNPTTVIAEKDFTISSTTASGQS